MHRGPRIRADIICCFIARRGILGLEFLQMRRTDGHLSGSWQPIMGSCEEGEDATTTMWREVREETGLEKSAKHLLGAWSLEGVRPFFMARANAVVLSPTFLLEVSREWHPVLNEEHDAHRWTQEDKVAEMFLWPGHAMQAREAAMILRGHACEAFVRVPVA